MSQRRYPWRQGIVSGALAAVAGLAVLVLPFTRSLSHLSYDLAFLFRSHQPVSGVSIIYMDVASEERLHQGRWEKWDRSLHADLLPILKRAGAAAVVFDVVFLQGTNEVANQRLVHAARDHGRVAAAAVA